jgi:tetratricopeptide (TPR) repeat protein
VVLEDLQWLAESLLPLRELSVLASQLPVLMIGSYRDDERPHLPEKLPDMRVLKLERLNDEHIRELSVAMLGQAGRRRPVQELLRRETEGNVFFVVEVLRTLAEDLGGLHEVGRAELPPEIFSASIQEFIERRLARVPADYRPLLRLAAVAGRTIDVPVIARLLEMLPDTPFATGMEATFSLEEWLFGCADVAVLEHKNETWRFSHDKLREAARDTLSAALIPAAHRLIAAAIESVQSDLGVQATPLAFHWGRAGEAEKEYEYSVLAGQRALQSGANEQAAGLLRRALELVSRGQVALATVMEEFRLHIWLGTALMATRGWGSKEVRDVYRRARELAPRVGAGEELFSVLWGLWAAHLLRDEGQAMTVLAGQLMEVAQDADDDDLRLEAHLALGVTRRHQGQHETASAYLEQVVAAYDRQAHADHSFRFGQDPAVVAYSLAAGELWLMGYADQAREQLRHGMNLAEALGYPFNVAYNLVEWARLMQMMGDRGQTLKWARRVIELSEQHSFPMMLAIGRVLRGWAMDEVAGERRIKETQHGLILLHLTGAKYAYPHYLGCLADVYAQTGKVDAAVALVDEALEVVHQAPFYEAELLRLKGEFLRKATGEHDAEAAYLFEQALRTAESRGQVAWVLRALLSWYRLLAASGRGAGLRSRLREAYRWFSEGFDTPDLQAVRAIVTREEGE